MMQRVALAVRYDGAGYHGWQHQENVVTVQDSLERALARVANHSVSLVCAGRTDAGVHATGQIVHFDTDANRDERSWTFGANANLSSDITVLWAKRVSDDFHARFAATARTYRYVLLNQDVRPGILKNAVGWYFRHLEVGPMHQAAQYLLGEHDFSAFQGSGCQAKHPNRTVYQLDVIRKGNMLVFEIKANAFLLHMVRNIVGTLIQVGEGAKPVSWISEVLHARDRRAAGVTIMPNGLYLVAVDYPQRFDLPKIAKGPFFLG